MFIKKGKNNLAMKNLTYEEFRGLSKKKVDAWVEVLIFDVFAVPLSYLFYKLFRNIKGSPYYLTASHFIIKMFSAYYFFIGNWVAAPVLFFAASIIDSTDGRIARAIYGHDPDSRGMMDYFLDMTALCILFSSIAIHLSNIGNLTASLLMIVMLASTMFFLAMTSARHRIYNLYSYKANSKLSETNPDLSNNAIMNTLFKIQKFAAKFGLSFHPSFMEAESLVLLIFPFFPSQNWLIILAIIFMLVDAFAVGLLPSVMLLRTKGR